MDNLQFYPTPMALAEKAWHKFKNKDFERVLEPSAGNGDLLDACPEARSYGRGRAAPCDCCEIDLSRHPILRQKGYNVVGLDFLEFGGGNIYSHILMNPPFAYGAKHVLKAWDAIWDGEIVAILNAETIRNPCSVERQMLVDLISAHGEVEFMVDQFNTGDAEVKTDVEIALVYLRKEADVQTQIFGDIISELSDDLESGKGLSRAFAEINELAHVNTNIENLVRIFNASVRLMQASVFAEARARYYRDLLGETMAIRTAGRSTAEAGDKSAWVRNTIGERYLELKDRAWAEIIRSADVTSRLSSKTQREAERQFEDIKKLEFTVSNVYGFLLGIIEQKGEMDLQMALEVFDTITRYHTDNLVFYKGWKSNDKHRTCGMRLKTTRFVLPYHRTESYQSSFSWETERLLSDFDKVFAMLDGKQKPELSLLTASRQNFNALRRGARISSSYFDIRYYPGAGTIHFFPTNKEVLDRLNRSVGRKRKWLPDDRAQVSESFWEQYEKAEKFDKELRGKVASKRKGAYGWGPLDVLARGNDDGSEPRAEWAHDEVDACLTEVLEKHGISTDFQLQDASTARPVPEKNAQQLALLAA